MSQQASPEPQNWTIAYRKPRANRFVRAANWSGTWAEAVELSGRFGELHPGLQIFYVPTRQAELDGYVTVEDIANILTDNGKRVRVTEGELDAQDLAAMINPEADEAHAVLDHGTSWDGRNSYPTPPVYLAPRAADSPAAVGDKVIFDSSQATVVAVYPVSETSPYAKVKIRYRPPGPRRPSPGTLSAATTGTASRSPSPSATARPAGRPSRRPSSTTCSASATTATAPATCGSPGPLPPSPGTWTRPSIRPTRRTSPGRSPRPRGG